MSDKNQVSLQGNFVKKPVWTEFTKGKSGGVATLEIAMNSEFKNRAGEKAEKTAFMTVKVFGPEGKKLVDKMGSWEKGANNTFKGIDLKGRFRMDTWKDKETQKGKKGFWVEANPNEIELSNKGYVNGKNSLNIAGRLVDNPVTRGSGENKVVTFTVVSNEIYIKPELQGKSREELDAVPVKEKFDQKTVFVECLLSGKRAGELEGLKKGMLVEVGGGIEQKVSKAMVDGVEKSFNNVQLGVAYVNEAKQKRKNEPLVSKENKKGKGKSK